ncbi:hypothetical protein DASC09_060850 [Saccharomycopsis crataegensis]|uniref:Uncharacterized protein n=1 Tax=Saccharomycopsis crataegensis TaxID=43959 RepID=A0AAV5QW50_9ASCO|nr:hypothetical protein DASC09_060850 [Saccharomycopsis crataegensis]
MSSNPSNYLYNLAHATLFNPALAQSYSFDFHANTTHPNLSINKTSQCPICKIPWVPGWNVSARIKYIKVLKKSKKFRERVLIYHCLACTQSVKFDGLIQKKPDTADGQYTGKIIPEKECVDDKKKKENIDDTKTNNTNLSKVTKNGANDSKTTAKKKKKKKIQLPKKAPVPKKDSLSLFDLMNDNN